MENNPVTKFYSILQLKILIFKTNVETYILLGEFSEDFFHIYSILISIVALCIYMTTLLHNRSFLAYIYFNELDCCTLSYCV